MPNPSWLASIGSWPHLGPAGLAAAGHQTMDQAVADGAVALNLWIVVRGRSARQCTGHGCARLHQTLPRGIRQLTQQVIDELNHVALLLPASGVNNRAPLDPEPVEHRLWPGVITCRALSVHAERIG